MTPDRAKVIADCLFAFTHPARLRMVQVLAGGELSAGGWAASSRVSECSLTQHAIILTHSGAVTRRRAGRFRLYSLVNSHVEDGVFTLAAHGVMFTMRLSSADPEVPAKKATKRKK